jgi:UDP-N-acetylglucosamine enolpyruvyl transferase
MLKLLGELGMHVHRHEPGQNTGIGGGPALNGNLDLEVINEKVVEARYDIVKTMRASICVLGPLLAKRKKAVVSIPGGCAIGDRPVDLHVRGLQKLAPEIRIEGVDRLTPTEHRIIPDRIECGTFMIAAAITNGELELKNCNLDHLIAVVDRLEEVGVKIERQNGTIFVSSNRRINPVEMTTQPFPGFPTDIQAQLMALLAIGDGMSVITERIFPDRFLHVGELNRMGARIRKEGPTAVIQGVKELQGAAVMASDLRASAALVLAGLVARGQTKIDRVYHIDRGYEKIEQKLMAVGADIERVKDR